MQTVSRPRLSGKVSAKLTKEASVSRNVKINNKYEKTNKNDFYLCTPTCPYRLAKLGTSLRMQGKLMIRKKEIIFFIKGITCLPVILERSQKAVGNRIIKKYEVE